MAVRRSSTSCGSCSCCAASPASVRPRCSSGRRRSSPTWPRPTVGPRRRATSRSPCSAGSASVRSSVTSCSPTTTTAGRSSSPAASPGWPRSRRPAVPRDVRAALVRRRGRRAAGAPRLRADHAPGRGRARAGAGLRHRRVRRVHRLPARPRPRTSASADRARCSPPTASCACCCGFAGARWLERLGPPLGPSSIAFVSLARALGALALFPDTWALWAAAVLIGVASAFLYPSLMALTVNRVDERERPMAISSFTMFFEVGNISGGVVFGLDRPAGRQAVGVRVGRRAVRRRQLAAAHPGRACPGHVARRRAPPARHRGRRSTGRRHRGRRLISDAGGGVPPCVSDFRSSRCAGLGQTGVRARPRPVLRAAADAGPPVRRVVRDGRAHDRASTAGRAVRPSCRSGATSSSSPTSAAAQQHGYRACKRCRPDASPGSPEWDVRGDVVARAVRLVADGVVDRDGVRGLARRLGYSERHLNRLHDRRARRRAARDRPRPARPHGSHAARDDRHGAHRRRRTRPGSAASGSSTTRCARCSPPTPSRCAHRRAPGPSAAGAVELELPVREPFAADDLLAFFAARAVPGVEHWDGTSYHRALDLPRGHGVVAVLAAPDPTGAPAPVAGGAAPRRLARPVGGGPARPSPARPRRRSASPSTRRSPPMPRSRRVGRRDAGPARAPAASIRSRPPCAPTIGQQISVAGARTVAGRIVAAVGERLADRRRSADPRVPERRGARRLRPGDAADAPQPGRTVVELARRVAAGELVLDRRRRSRRRAPRAARRPRHRSVDGGLRADARTRRSRRVPAHRSRRKRRPRRARGRRDARRALAPVALLRACTTCGRWPARRPVPPRARRRRR